MKRPWIKIIDADEPGICRVRCKDPKKAFFLFIHGVCLFSGEPVIDKYRLFLDDVEYDPPVVVHCDMHFEEAEALALEKLEYLIETHQAFYY